MQPLLVPDMSDIEKVFKRDALEEEEEEEEDTFLWSLLCFNI